MTQQAEELGPVRLLERLIAIDSVNPGLAASGAGEGPIADLCADWFGARGFEVHRLERNPGRPSLGAVAHGTGDGRSLMLNGHLDTVGLRGYAGEPLSPRIEDGKLFGRGACDMKGGVSAMMTAARPCHRARAVAR
jgi:acetylornithine deacetylase